MNAAFHVLFETRWDWVTFFVYSVRIASMILGTARFLCVPYAEICVNVTTDTVSYVQMTYFTYPRVPTDLGSLSCLASSQVLGLGTGLGVLGSWGPGQLQGQGLPWHSVGEPLSAEEPQGHFCEGGSVDERFLLPENNAGRLSLWQTLWKMQHHTVARCMKMISRSFAVPGHRPGHEDYSEFWQLEIISKHIQTLFLFFILEVIGGRW